MRIDDEIFLNQLAQGIVEIEKGLSWFRGLEAQARRDALHTISYFITNATPQNDDASRAIDRSGLKRTFTPCVLLGAGEDISQQLSKILNLPDAELDKAFRLTIALLGVADDRRRKTKPLDLTNHWWHRDLRDQRVIEAIRNERG
jgi:hypothetical protein